MILLPIIFGLLLSGCAPFICQVQVNGYTDLRAPALITPGAGICVVENQQAPNPLLEKEVKGKIHKLLEKQGYQISSFEKADYYLFFGYGIGPGRSVNVVLPDYSYGLGLAYSWPRSYFFVSPYFGYYPVAELLYDRWVLLNVVDGKLYREKAEFRSLWVGEARSTGTSADLRVAINYLLVAAFQHFGKDTGKAVTVDLREQDPGIRELTR